MKKPAQLQVVYFYQFINDFGVPQEKYITEYVEKGSDKHDFFIAAFEGKTICGCEYIKTQSITE